MKQAIELFWWINSDKILGSQYFVTSKTNGNTGS